MERQAYQRLHSNRRLLERYGLWKTEYYRKQIIHLIQNRRSLKDKDNARVIRRFTANKTLWEIKLNGHIIYPLYDSNTHDICTYLGEREVQSLSPFENKLTDEELLENTRP